MKIIFLIIFISFLILLEPVYAIDYTDTNSDEIYFPVNLTILETLGTIADINNTTIGNFSHYLIGFEIYFKNYSITLESSNDNGSSSSSPQLENYTYDPFGQRIKIMRNDSANTIIFTPFKELMKIVKLCGGFYEN